MPLRWLLTLDSLLDTKKACLSYDEVAGLAFATGMVSEKSGGPMLDTFLQYMHEKGMLMWHDETGLRGVIVLDALAFLVTPATIIICQHKPNKADNVETVHFSKLHERCRDKFPAEWAKFIDKGLLSDELLAELWSEPEYNEHKEQLVVLMTKFGLLLPIHAPSDRLYLVPALLPPSEAAGGAMCVEWTEELYQTCIFVFLSTGAAKHIDSSTYVYNDICRFGFLPRGMFERVIVKLVQWCQSLDGVNFKIGDHIAQLKSDTVELIFGSQRFRLTPCDVICGLRLDVVGQYALPIHKRVHDTIKQIILECMKALTCDTTLLFDKQHGGVNKQCYQDFLQSPNDHSILVPLDKMQTSLASCNHLSSILSKECIKEVYGAWLSPETVRDSYDVFLSYRWSAHDSAFVESLYDIFTQESIGQGQDNRSVGVFLDKVCLPIGDRFDKRFVKAMINTTVVVPIVSMEALDRMQSTKFSPDIPDNVMMEWVIAQYCIAHSKGNVRAVIPLMFGPRTSTGVESEEDMIGIFSSAKRLLSLSDAIPHATLAAARAHLGDNGIGMADDDAFHAQTVSQIVDKLLTFNGFLASECRPARNVRTYLSGKLMVEVASLCSARPAPPAGASSPSKQAAGAGAGADYSAAWDMMKDGKVVPKKKQEAFFELLDDLGVEAPEQLQVICEKYPSSRDEIVGMIKESFRPKVMECLGM